MNVIKTNQRGGIPSPRAPRAASLLPLFSSLLLFTAGCGDGLPETVPVSGTVTWQGEPLDDGTVVFHPQTIAAGLPRRNANGKLAADGAFSLSTFRTGDGAVPGTYRVTIHSYLSEPSSSDDDQNPGEYRWRIPERYGDPSRSGLTAKVESAGPQQFAFEIEDAPPD